MIPIDPQPADPTAAPAAPDAPPPEPTPETVASPAGAPPETGLDLPPPPPEEEEETDAQWIARFLLENEHLMPPRPAPAPPAPPSKWQGDPSTWLREEHKAIHPKGGYVLMRLLSRMQSDLAELTQGKRAATYPEVDEYLGYALIAEGLAPRGYSAADASAWWRLGGGSAYLKGATSGAGPLSAAEPERGIVSANATDVQVPDSLATQGIPADQFLSSLGSAGSHTAAETPSRSVDIKFPVQGESTGPAAPPATQAKTSIPSAKASRVTGSAARAQARAAAVAAAEEEKMALRAKRRAGLASTDPYSADNLKLGVNNIYTEQIKLAAQQSGLPVQALSAIISAEAAKDRAGLWDPKSKNAGTSASGLTQFVVKTWIGEGQRNGSYLNGIARGLGYLNKRGAILPEHRQEFLDLRFDPQHSISAAADYAAQNLAALRREKLILDETPAALARYAYVMHHEGPGGGPAFLRGDLKVSDTAWNRNIPAPDRAGLLAANGQDRNIAYRNFMAGYTDQKIDVRRYMIDPDGIEVPATATLYRGETKDEGKQAKAK